MTRYKDTWGSSQDRINRLIVTTKVKGGNVLTASVLKEAARLDSLVSHSVYASAGMTEDEPLGLQSFGQTYGRSDLCYPKVSHSECSMTNFALELFYVSASGTYNFEHNDTEIAEIVERGYGNDPVLFPDGAEGRKARPDHPTAPAVATSAHPLPPRQPTCPPPPPSPLPSVAGEHRPLLRRPHLQRSDQEARDGRGRRLALLHGGRGGRHRALLHQPCMGGAGQAAPIRPNCT